MKKFHCLLLTMITATAAFSQNVGIGTVNPIYSMDVADSASGTIMRLRAISNTVGSRALLRFSTNTNGSALGFNSSYFGSERRGNGTALVFGTASSSSLAPGERMRLNEEGLLGIGTDSPLARLHLDLSNISTHSNALIINDDDDPIVYFQRNNVNGGFIQYVGDDFKVGTPINNNLGRFIVRTNGADRMFVNNIGNVGIGISSPTSRLHVLGDGVFRANDALVLLENSAGDDKGIFYIGNNDVRIGTSPLNDDGKFHIRTNNVDRMTFNSIGLTGIGTTNPGHFFVIDATSSLDNTPVVLNTVGTRDIQFQRNGAESSYIRFSTDNMMIGTYQNNSTGNLYFATRETNHMRLDNIGRLSIGVSSPNIPGYRLSVRGDIICEDITLLPFAAWPDYVFEKGYRLRPLSELESFINSNHHLPGIAPARDIEKKGIQLKDMQRQLMEKVEELTLYVIELNKKNDLLQKEVELLKQTRRIGTNNR